MATKKQPVYWFKRRRYGYGWIPSTWQGWVSLLLFLAVILAASSMFKTGDYSPEKMWLYLNIGIVAVVLLLIVASAKGPKAKWRWGKKPGDNPNEDF